MVVTMCAQEMKVEGAPTDWTKYFQQQDVIQCHLEDTTLKSARRCSGLSGFLFATVENRLQPFVGTVHAGGRSGTCSFTALVASITARGFYALGSLSLTNIPHWRPCSCCKNDQHSVLGAIDPMSWKRCGTWKVCAQNGRETSAQHTEANLCRGSSVETVRDEPGT